MAIKKTDLLDSIEVETLLGRLTVNVENRSDYQVSPRERLKTGDFLALEAYLAENTAYRPAGTIMNLAARRTAVNGNEISMFTGYEDVVRCGKKAEAVISGMVTGILEEAGIRTNDDCEVTDHSAIDPCTSTVSSPMVEVDLSSGQAGTEGTFAARVLHMAADHNSSQNTEAVKMCGTFSFEEETGNVVYLSVDDVLVHRQKTVRKNGRECVVTTWIYHTVVHIETIDGIYVLEASRQKKALSTAMAFLIKNGLTDRYLIFFMDGEETIKEGINEIFSGWPHTIIMDYYHVKERVTELFSGAFKPGKIVDDTVEPEYFKNGKVKKGSVKRITRSQYYVRTFMSMLWYGNVDEALEWLEAMKTSDQLKPGTGLSKIESSITYINNKRDRLTCFAMRKLLGLRNSSNQVEIANNTIVAHRQKRKGLSWSEEGSFACSHNTVVFKNYESECFFKQGCMKFAPRKSSVETDESEIDWIRNIDVKISTTLVSVECEAA